MYRIEYVEIGDNKPFKEFIDSLSFPDRAKIFEKILYFLKIKNLNLSISENLSKYLEDGIYELRVSLKDKTARIFYYYIIHQKIIITHAFIKKEQKVSRKEIRRSKKLRFEYNKKMNYDKL